MLFSFELGYCPCPNRWGWQHYTTPNNGSLCVYAFWDRPHIYISRIWTMSFWDFLALCCCDRFDTERGMLNIFSPSKPTAECDLYVVYKKTCRKSDNVNQVNQKLYNITENLTCNALLKFTNLSWKLQSSAVLSSIPSLWSSEANGVSSWSLVPQTESIIQQSLFRSCCRSATFGPTFCNGRE